MSDVGFAALPNFIARDGAIEPPLKVLLLALSSYAGADQTCFPSNKTLQGATGLSERTIRDWLRVGEERGLLMTHRRVAADGSMTSNLYELNFSKWSNPKARQSLPQGGADSAGGWGDVSPGDGATGRPRWGDASPPNNTSDQNQKNITITNSAPNGVPAAALAPTVGEVEELVLPLRKAKPVRELTQAQQTAILNRKLALAAVAEWNATIGRNTAPCIPNSQWERRCASVVAQAVASLGGINGFGGLCEWAIDRNPYYAGLAYPGRNNEIGRAHV